MSAAGTPTTAVFDLPDRLAAKADPALIRADEEHLAAIARCLDETVTELADRLAVERRAAGRGGQQALDRDSEVHRLTARLRTLRRFGVDLCLGRIVPAQPAGAAPVYIGRLGLTDRAGRRLLVDWRAPAAEPFFAATHARPEGLASRRRYRWTDGRITDYWDEAFTEQALCDSAALDDQSAFIASLGTSRSPRMRDVLGTIQADQDAIIRAGSSGALVVDGGPGTGKTVVALHRAAYLLYADPRLGPHRGGVLVVGPHQPYLDYVADVLPGLGEDGVQTATVRDLVPEGATAELETDARVAALKSSARMVSAIDAAVLFSEEPPAEAMVLETAWADVRLTAADWAEAFAAAPAGTAHNDARELVWDELLTILAERHDADAPSDRVRLALQQDRSLADAFQRAWPVLDGADVLADLWSVPAYLRLCAPWLTPDEVRALQRAEPRRWTAADLPLLDAARRRVGDPSTARRRHRRLARAAAQSEQRSRVIEDLIASDDSEMLVMSMLRGADLQAALDEDPDAPVGDRLAGPFAHVVVDEAQELTDAEWQMVLQRCPSHSLTIVGDRAQARRGFGESWRERLARVGVGRIDEAALQINYRTPAEVMAVAAPVIRAVLPDANVPTSIRSNGIPVRYGDASQLDAILAGWIAEHAEGVACVVSAGGNPVRSTRRIRSLSPELCKGLEFDLVVLVDPHTWGSGVPAAVDRYVAMTRATRELVVLTSGSG